MSVTFSRLSAVNALRLPLFKNSKGGRAHAVYNGSDWSPAEWGCAVAGEAGELCNVLKKVLRGDMTLDEARPLIAQEAADTVIYIDLLCQVCRIDLGTAVVKTFNAKSEALGIPVKLPD